MPKITSTEPVATTMAPASDRVNATWLRSGGWVLCRAYKVYARTPLKMAATPIEISLNVPKSCPRVKNKMMKARLNRPAMPVAIAIQPIVLGGKFVVGIVCS
jgi:hypothetical protein